MSRSAMAARQSAKILHESRLRPEDSMDVIKTLLVGFRRDAVLEQGDAFANRLASDLTNINESFAGLCLDFVGEPVSEGELFDAIRRVLHENMTTILASLRKKSELPRKKLPEAMA